MGQREQVRREHFAEGAIYGTVVYLTVLVLLEEDRTDPGDAAAILVGTALVFWLAHVYAHLVPRIAAEGRLRTGRMLEAAEDQIGILAAVAIPLIPLVLAMLDLLADRAGMRWGVAAGIVSLAVFAAREARTAGVGWGRSLWVAAILVAAGVGLLWLEVSLH
ncbi:MAG TPA: hypothetical protein VFI35_09525 [Actinomycetota bacterium]|nr:hypothetical protein [Actinomycetota bacterium]